MKKLLTCALLSLTGTLFAAVLENGGNLITHPGLGTGGFDVSMTPSTFNGTLGLNFRLVAPGPNWKRADDWTSSCAYRITKLSFFGYETSGNVPSWTTVPNLDLFIVPGSSPSGINAIPLNTIAPVVTQTNIYRVGNGAANLTNTLRLINRLDVNLASPLVLAAGQYWWTIQVPQTTGSAWMPPVTLPDPAGQTATNITTDYAAGNSQVLDATNTWIPSVIGTAPNTFQVAFPFVVEGTKVGFSGTVTFGDWPQTQKPTIDVFLESGNGNVTINNVPVDDNGNYTVCVPRAESYDVFIKASHWLRKSVGAVDTTTSNPTGVNVSLINGDVDGNNEVGPADFALLATAFGTEFGDAGYLAGADLDGNLEVGPADFAILSSNFGLEGD